MSVIWLIFKIGFSVVGILWMLVCWLYIEEFFNKD